MQGIIVAMAAKIDHINRIWSIPFIIFWGVSVSITYCRIWRTKTAAYIYLMISQSCSVDLSPWVSVVMTALGISPCVWVSSLADSYRKCR